MRPEQKTLHDELKLRNPRVHIRNLGGRDQRSICQTGCLGADQCFATQIPKINTLSWRFADVWTQMTIDTFLQLLLREIQLSLWWASKLLQLIETVCGLVKTLSFNHQVSLSQLLSSTTHFLDICCVILCRLPAGISIELLWWKNLGQIPSLSNFTGAKSRV